MFVYDNGKINVAAHTKCGHSTMYTYFNLPMHSFTPETANTKIWMNNPSSKIIVLRHPIERMNSAINTFKKYFSPVEEYYTRTKDIGGAFGLIAKNFAPGTPTFTVVRNVYFSVLTGRATLDEMIYRYHCFPYMHTLNGVDYKIIHFDKLSDYLLKNTGPITNTSTRDLDALTENSYVSREDLIKETELYEKLLVTKEEISVDEWKMLTLG